MSLEGRTVPFPQPLIPFDDNRPSPGSGTWPPDRGTSKGGYRRQRKKQAAERDGSYLSRLNKRSGGPPALGPSIAITIPQLVRPVPVCQLTLHNAELGRPTNSGSPLEDPGAREESGSPSTPLM